jgi:hypothetical protein
MTLPVAGNPLSLSQIQGEFGGSDPVSLNEYYAGGTYVSAGTVGYPGDVSTPIPSSGAISIANFYGATKYLYSFTVTTGWTNNPAGFGSYSSGYDTTTYTLGSISGSYTTILGTVNSVLTNYAGTKSGSIQSTVIKFTSVSAGSFVVGRTYQITTLGTTDFTLIGAASNTIGTIFTATGVGTGTGTANAQLSFTSLQLTRGITETFTYGTGSGSYTSYSWPSGSNTLYGGFAVTGLVVACTLII